VLLVGAVCTVLAGLLLFVLSYLPAHQGRTALATLGFAVIHLAALRGARAAQLATLALPLTWLPMALAVRLLASSNADVPEWATAVAGHFDVVLFAAGLMIAGVGATLVLREARADGMEDRAVATGTGKAVVLGDLGVTLVATGVVIGLAGALLITILSGFLPEETQHRAAASYLAAVLLTAGLQLAGIWVGRARKAGIVVGIPVFAAIAYAAAANDQPGSSGPGATAIAALWTLADRSVAMFYGPGLALTTTGLLMLSLAGHLRRDRTSDRSGGGSPT
jgi:hypothetical protein